MVNHASDVHLVFHELVLHRRNILLLHLFGLGLKLLSHRSFDDCIDCLLMLLLFERCQQVLLKLVFDIFGLVLHLFLTFGVLAVLIFFLARHLSSSFQKIRQHVLLLSILHLVLSYHFL